MQNSKQYPIWHPFTQHAVADPPILISHARGAYLYTKDGRRIIDGIGSWWVNIHGHCHPRIVRAVQEQAAILDQIIFAGFTHEPAEQLTEALLQLVGPPYAHVFYSDSGSTAVEVALKMATGYWYNRGETRPLIIALDHAYHGDTFGTMAVGGRSVFNAAYEPYLFEVARIPFPHHGQEQETLTAFDQLIAQHPNRIAALIVEPLILGAGGMLVYTPETLRGLADRCREQGVLLIADEVMTGWGRTGTMFACEQAQIQPDLVCLSKGLTAGFLPMGMTLATSEIFQAFYSADRRKTFFHSSSFTGNPLACAAALAAMSIWQEEPVFERIKLITEHHRHAQKRFATRDDVYNVRGLGTILALDLRDEDEGYLSPLGPRLYRMLLDHGVLLRPLGNTLYVMPPYCVSATDLEEMYAAIEQSLDAIRG